MSWNKDAAVSYLRSHALGHSHNECAKFTRRAIIAGSQILPSSACTPGRVTATRNQPIRFTG